MIKKGFEAIYQFQKVLGVDHFFEVQKLFDVLEGQLGEGDGDSYLFGQIDLKDNFTKNQTTISITDQDAKNYADYLGYPKNKSLSSNQSNNNSIFKLKN